MRRCLPFALLALSAPALAQERDFCADRPGIGTSACTLAPGSAMLEVGVAEWDRAADAASVDDTLTFADTLVRVGVAQSAEVQFGLTGYVHDRLRARVGGVIRTAGAGDGFVGVRRGIAGTNGPVAVEAFATLPVGHAGSGDWSAGVLLPIDLDLNGLELNLSPEADAAVDADGNGRHFAYGGVIGLSHDLGPKFSLGAELAAFENLDPAGHSLDARVTGSLTWQASPRLQLDVEADLGLSDGAPHHALMVGFAERLR